MQTEHHIELDERSQMELGLIDKRNDLENINDCIYAYRCPQLRDFRCSDGHYEKCIIYQRYRVLDKDKRKNNGLARFLRKKKHAEEKGYDWDNLGIGAYK